MRRMMLGIAVCDARCSELPYHATHDARNCKWLSRLLTRKSPHLYDPKKGWKRILKRAQIANLHLHDLRTLGSYMAMTGASLSVIGNALNHKDVSTTRKVYAHSAHEAEHRP